MKSLLCVLTVLVMAAGAVSSQTEFQPTGSDVTLTHVEQGTCDFVHAHVNGTDSAANGGITRVWRAKNSVRWNDSGGKAHVTIAGAPGDSTLQIACVTYQDT